jgi:hypothetical protein
MTPPVVTEHADLARWMEGYERAWRTPGTALLQDLFTPNATYLSGPFAQPIHGLSAIASFWESERDGADEVFVMDWEPVAMERSVAVTRLEVRYGDPTTRVYRDLWIVNFERDGRCSAFQEWPFFPGQPLSGREASGGEPAD